MKTFHFFEWTAFWCWVNNDFVINLRLHWLHGKRTPEWVLRWALKATFWRNVFSHTWQECGLEFSWIKMCLFRELSVVNGFVQNWHTWWDTSLRRWYCKWWRKALVSIVFWQMLQVFVWLVSTWHWWFFINSPPQCSQTWVLVTVLVFTLCPDFIWPAKAWFVRNDLKFYVN